MPTAARWKRRGIGGGKLAGETLRLAAVMHCVEHGPVGDIGVGSLTAAIAIARFLIPHAEAVLGMMLATDATTDDDARYVLRWIERHAKRAFTKSEAQQDGRRRFPSADDIDPALAELTRRGYIRPRPTESTGPGRPRSPAYEVNPAAFAGKKPRKRAEYPENPPQRPSAEGSQDIQYTSPESQAANPSGPASPAPADVTVSPDALPGQVRQSDLVPMTNLQPGEGAWELPRWYSPRTVWATLNRLLQLDGVPAPGRIDPKGPRCPRCGSPRLVDVLIHEGRSLRRSCAQCDRTLPFPVWHGTRERCEGVLEDKQC